MNELIEIYQECNQRLLKRDLPKNSFFAIVAEYDKDYGIKWSIQHDGTFWSIDKVLPYSNNNFDSFDVAEERLKSFLFIWNQSLISMVYEELEVVPEEFKEVSYKFDELLKKDIESYN